MISHLRPGAVSRTVPRFTVGDAVVYRADGHQLAVLATGGCDAGALDEHASARLHAAMTHLYDTLTGPLQLVVQIRPWSGSVRPGGTVSGLDADIAGHSAAHVERAEPLQRRVLCVLSAASASQLEGCTDTASGVLGTAGIHAERLRGDALRSLYADLERTWTVAAWQVSTGEEMWRGTVLRRFPGGDTSAGWMAPLLGAALCGDIAIHVRPLANADALRALRRKLRDHSSQQLSDAAAGRVDDIRTEVAVDNIDYLRERLAANRSRPVEIAVVALVRATDGRSLRRRTGRLDAAWSMTGATAAPAHFQHDAAAMSVLPLARCDIDAWKLCDSVAAATMQPWLQVTVDDPEGYRLGHHARDRVPITLDPFATDATANANVAVMAASGHGKSFTLSLLMLEALRRGRAVIALDPEGEYRGLTESLGGTYIDLAPGSTRTLNIFETGVARGETAAAVVELVAILCGGLDATERALVDAAATACLAGKRVPVLHDLVQRLGVSSPRITAVLARHCRDVNAMLMSRPAAVAGDTRFLTIGYRDLPTELVPAVTYVVAQWLWTVVRRQRCRRHIVVDEVGLLLDHPALRALLVQLARRCRKYDASLVVATQNAADLLSQPDAAVIATNAATVLLGGQRAADVAVMERAFGLTEGQSRILESAHRGEFLLISGSRRLHTMIDAPPGYRDLMRGRGGVSC